MKPNEFGRVRYRFRNLEFHEDSLTLFRSGEMVRLQPQVALLLCFLIKERDRIVSKHDVNSHIWGNRIASDASIDNTISRVRSVLGDSGDTQEIIKTFPGRGFQFIADVQELTPCKAKTAGSDELANAILPSHSPRTPTWIAALLGVIAIAAIISFASEFPRKGDGAQSVEYDAAIAVLPFQEVGGKEDQPYLGMGLANELTTVLARIDGLRVTSSTSAFRLAGNSGQTVSETAEALGVSHLVEGSVAREGASLKVTVHLVDALEDDRIWTETYSRPYDVSNVIRIQEQIVSAIAAKMLGELAPQSETLPVKTESTEALELYLQAQPLMRDRTAKSVLQAIELLKQAVAADPNYVDAYSGLFFAYNSSYFFGDLTWDDLETTRDLALEKAVELDPTDPQVLQAVGMIEMITGKPREAIATLQQSLIREPNNVRALNIIAGAYRALGRATEEREFLRKAQELDPLNPRVLNLLARAEFNLGETEKALEVARVNLRWNAADPSAQLRMAILHIQVGDYVAGHDLLNSVLRTNPGNYRYARIASGFYMRVGWEAKAELAAASMPHVKAELDAVLSRREEVERFLSANPEYDTDGSDQGIMYFYLRDFESALPFMKRAIEELETTGPADLGWGKIYRYLSHAHVLRDAGDPDGDVILEKIEQTLAGETPQTADNDITFLASAGVQMLKGNEEQAIDWLEAAFEDGHVFLNLMRHPTFTPLASNPRYEALRKRMELRARELRDEFAEQIRSSAS